MSINHSFNYLQCECGDKCDVGTIRKALEALPVIALALNDIANHTARTHLRGRGRLPEAKDYQPEYTP